MKTVLIIEDNPDSMKLISFILEKQGYKTLLAETGEKGLEIAFNEKPDFIMLDIQLPGIDGLEVLQKIRNAEPDGRIPIIALTSYAMSGDREKMMASGCNGYIEKPIDPGRIIDQIREVLENRP